jgi:pimeloyl-ACP methyl ester carboxylesterase
MNIIIDNLATQYSERGQGPILLLLHGWGSSSDIFDGLAQSLELSHRIIALNLPGFGGTEMPPVTWGVADYAQFVLHFCEEKGFQPDIILGHSLGGQIAVFSVGNGLMSPRKLILVSAAVIRTKPATSKQAIRLLAKTGKAVLGTSRLGMAARKRLYSSVGSSEYLDLPAMQPTYRRVITEDQTEAARKINCPTLLLWGCDDRDTPVQEGRIVAGVIPASKLIEFEGGHFIFLDDAPNVTAAIIEFLK